MLLVTGFLFKYKFWEKKVFLFFQPTWLRCCVVAPEGGAGGVVLPYMGYIGMCHCEGYGFQFVYSRIGYINQSVWV